MVMGEHTRGLLLSLFIKDNARAVMEKAVCPVWYVPRRR
jgi:nucleotide-binding universal stress UspA family protein